MSISSFVMFKPDALDRHLESVLLDEFIQHGFVVVRQKSCIVDEALILAHYQEVIERVPIADFKDRILKAFVNKTVQIFEMSSDSDQTVEKIRALIGPTDPTKANKDTLRGKYGQDSMLASTQEKRMLNNLIHASDSNENAQKELALWFK